MRSPDDPPGTSRLFVAVPVADEVRAAVGELMQAVAGGPIGERASGQPRWVRVDGLHLTLRFLGATPDERQPELAAAMVAAARGVAQFRVVLSGGGAFPDRRLMRQAQRNGVGGGEFSEIAAEGELLVVGDFLVAEEQHLPLQQRLVNVVNFRGTERLAEIHAADFGADHGRGWPDHNIRLTL